MNVSLLDCIKSKYLSIEVSAKSSLKIFETSTGIKSLWNCLEICEIKYQCHYVEYNFASQDCWLYHKTANLEFFGAKDWSKIYLYARLIYRQIGVQGIMILNEHLMKKHANDSESCWKECLTEEKCSLINYQYSTNDCYLIEDQYTISYLKDNKDFTAVGYFNIFGDENRNFSLFSN